MIGMIAEQAKHGAGDWIFGILLLGAVVGFMYWMVATPNGKAYAQRAQERKAARKPKTMSQIATSGAAGGSGLACPKCGGNQFKVQRKTSTKVMFGAASLLGQAKWVRCVTCATRYRRG